MKQPTLEDQISVFSIISSIDLDLRILPDTKNCLIEKNTRKKKQKFEAQIQFTDKQRALKDIYRMVYIQQYKEEGSYFTKSLFKKWINQVLLPHSKTIENSKKGLLLLDNLSSHDYDDLQSDQENMNYEIMFLPPNTTDLLQQLTKSINKNIEKCVQTINIFQVTINNKTNSQRFYRIFSLSMDTERYNQRMFRNHGIAITKIYKKKTKSYKSSQSKILKIKRMSIKSKNDDGEESFESHKTLTNSQLYEFFFKEDIENSQEYNNKEQQQ
ncbi:DDE family endonuclease (macronuclear) [Tetrahymena thermophila SB210]|uniref:DDE family endonuclease n=1 Tax=Tetrahymena thermophila (strain SB210) TaxID=312017 RepID=Q241S2_TETTS|nr:DDE family endonuclease [Tetrahymena thermophila SB210]EAS02498.1 DDE family endonuclease [Tetrahymena thermophila SB210]|eukprot:XP_001022743.1 DDE family endonuclease [Tetrahymena thermophila SB210]